MGKDIDEHIGNPVYNLHSCEMGAPMKVEIQNILYGSTWVTVPEGMDADACACRATDITGIPWRVYGQGQCEATDAD